MARRKFTDLAGYTRHCWECEHSGKWNAMNGYCEKRMRVVRRFDSPNNPCSKASGCLEYECGGDKPAQEEPRTCGNCENSGELCLGCSRHYPDLHMTEDEWKETMRNE